MCKHTDDSQSSVRGNRRCEPVQNRGLAGAVQAEDQDPHLAAAEQVTEVTEQPTCKPDTRQDSLIRSRDGGGNTTSRSSSRAPAARVLARPGRNKRARR